MLPHHEFSSHTGLVDSIKGALGVRTIVKGEHFCYIGHTVFVIACAHKCYRHVTIKLVWSI